jgi:hypothetical protein
MPPAVWGGFSFTPQGRGKPIVVDIRPSRELTRTATLSRDYLRDGAGNHEGHVKDATKISASRAATESSYWICDVLAGCF